MSLLNNQHFGLLGGMLVLAASINLQLLRHLAAQRSLGQHADDSVLDNELGLFSQQTAIGGFLQAAGITAVLVVDLLIQLLAGQNDLGGIDDDDKVTGVNIGV